MLFKWTWREKFVNRQLQHPRALLVAQGPISFSRSFIAFIRMKQCAARHDFVCSGTLSIANIYKQQMAMSSFPRMECWKVCPAHFMQCSCPKLCVQSGILSGPQSFVYMLGCRPKARVTVRSMQHMQLNQWPTFIVLCLTLPLVSTFYRYCGAHKVLHSAVWVISFCKSFVLELLYINGVHITCFLFLLPCL